MKLSKSFHGVLIGSALLLVTDAFAANKGTLHVSSPEIVAGERLAAGDYTVRWDGTGLNTEIRVTQGGKVVVTAPARIVPLDNASPSNSVVVQIAADGSRRVSQISFSGQKLALQIEESPGGAIVQGNN
jgi:YD repeat-containing protein